MSSQVVTAIAATLSLTVMAQAGGLTWNGLQFGMTEDGARLKLGKAFAFEPLANKGDYSLSPDYEINGPLTYLFKPSLVFDPDGLAIVNLEFDVPKVLAENKGKLDDKKLADIGGAVKFVAMIAGPDIYQELITKYGKPISMKGQCESATSAMAISAHFSCEADWKGDAQLVSLVWFYDSPTDKLDLVVVYKAQSNAL